MYTQNPCEDYVDSAAKQCLQIHLTPSQGDILIFMPGQEEIETTCDVIAGKSTCNSKGGQSKCPNASTLN